MHLAGDDQCFGKFDFKKSEFLLFEKLKIRKKNAVKNYQGQNIHIISKIIFSNFDPLIY